MFVERRAAKCVIIELEFSASEAIPPPRAFCLLLELQRRAAAPPAVPHGARRTEGSPLARVPPSLFIVHTSPLLLRGNGPRSSEVSHLEKILLTPRRAKKKKKTGSAVKVEKKNFRHELSPRARPGCAFLPCGRNSSVCAAKQWRTFI